MIVNFNVQNFGPIKEKQTLSFEADKSIHLENQYVISLGKYRLLKLALIYGANASGKTTILKALDFLRDLVLEPEERKTNQLDFEPYLFSEESMSSTSIISIEFIQNEIKYYYEIEFVKEAIVNEKLEFFKPNRAIVFKRTTDLENQFSEISFGSKIKVDKSLKKALESNTLWNNTVLGGFLKTNIEVNELKEVLDWFGHYLRPLIFTRTDLNSYVTEMINDLHISKKSIVNILRRADFDISDIVIKEEELEVPNDLLDFMEKRFKRPIREGEHRIASINLNFEHTVGDQKHVLPFNSESEGTKRYYGFAGVLTLLINNSVAFPIDELEASLHPDLYIHFLLSFLINSEESQLIATTHNREVLNNRDIFRDDSIWITDKGDTHSTSLYSLIDFDSSVIRKDTNRLNAYKSGRLGGTPSLGDYYL